MCAKFLTTFSQSIGFCYDVIKNCSSVVLLNKNFLSRRIIPAHTEELYSNHNDQNFLYSGLSNYHYYNDQEEMPVT